MGFVLTLLILSVLVSVIWDYRAVLRHYFIE